MGAAESKLLFTDIFNELTTAKNVQELGQDFWDRFWSVPTSSEEIFNAVAPSDIRKLRDEAPEHLLYLIQKIAERVESFFTTEEQSNRDVNRQLLNCVRLLTRILPYCFEVVDIGLRVAKIICPSVDPQEQSDWHGLTVAAVDLLFTPGLTLPSQFGEKSKIFYVIWESGIGSDSPIGSYQELDLNRHEVMRLILVLMSWQIYTAPRVNSISPFGFIITCTIKEPVVLALLCSLLNMIVKFDPIGWGIPYNYYLFPDYGEMLVNTAVQLLNAFLDYDPSRYIGNDGPIPGETKDDSTSYILEKLTLDPKSYVNSFRYYISKLYRPEDFGIILHGFVRLITNPIHATNTYLPGSTKQLKVYPEIITLFWRLIQFNPNLFRFIIDSDEVLNLLSALTHYSTDQRFNQSSDGLVHLACFIILHFSSEREFSVKLNQPFYNNYYSQKIPNFSGNYADFLILSFCQIIGKSKHRLYSIGECLLMTIVNVSPFIKTLSVDTCNKLIGLFEKCSQPVSLYMTPGPYPKLSSLLLEIFNYFIQYQYDGNSHVVYSLLRKKKSFYDAANYRFDDYNKYLSEIVDSATNDTVETPKPLTEEQFQGIKKDLDFTVLLEVLNSLTPEIEKLCKNIDTYDERTILTFLQSRTLVGLIPLPKPISIRRFKMSRDISGWLTSYLYGVIFLHNIDPPIWYGTNIKLFTVKSSSSA